MSTETGIDLFSKKPDGASMTDGIGTKAQTQKTLKKKQKSFCRNTEKLQTT